METFLYRYPKSKTRRTVVLVYPNAYSIGMANLGFQHVYHLLQSNPELAVERAFVEPGAKRVLTFESGREIGVFDAVVFTISFENDLYQIYRAFAAGGIPFDPRERTRPFVIAGGIGTTFMAQYLAKCCDVIASGDAEILLRPLVEALLRFDDNVRRLRALEDTPGIYPYSKIESRFLDYLPAPALAGPAHTAVLSDENEFPGTGLIEVSRGCKFRCAFCFISRVCGKYRPFDTDEILAVAGRYRGLAKRLGLVAATPTNHPDFKRIVGSLNEMGFTLSFSSFRIEETDDELLQAIIENENKTLTIAPEAASDSMKTVVRKNIPNGLIVETVEKAAKLGIKRLKLYFLYGLPGETQEDVEAIVRLVTKIRDAAVKASSAQGYVPEIIVDLNPFVSKPFTPLSEEPFGDVALLKKKLVYLKNRLRGLGRVFVIGESPKTAYVQYRIARGLIEWKDILENA